MRPAARLLPDFEPREQLHPVLSDHDLVGRVAPEQGLSALLVVHLAHAEAAPEVLHAEVAQRWDDHPEVLLPGAGVQPEHECVTVSVEHEAGQQVPFPVTHTIRISVTELPLQRSAQRERRA